MNVVSAPNRVTIVEDSKQYCTQLLDEGATNGRRKANVEHCMQPWAKDTLQDKYTK